MTRANIPSVMMGFFSTSDRPVSLLEFTEFWRSLTSSEKDYYRFIAEF